MNKIEEKDIQEVFDKIREIKEKYQDEINNSTNVSNIFQEIVYYYRDLLIMGYNLNNISEVDKQQLDFLEKILERQAKKYNENTTQKVYSK